MEISTKNMIEEEERREGLWRRERNGMSIRDKINKKDRNVVVLSDCWPHRQTDN